MHAEWPAGAWLDEESGELTTRGTMFALVLADYPPEDGAEAVRRLRERIPYRQGPQTADLKATLREVVMERDLERRALPDGAFTPPDEVKAIIESYFEKVGDPTELRLKRSRDPEAKIEAGRAVARARIADEAKPKEGALVVTKERTVNPVTACGVRWGERAVKKEGVWCCPKCGSPISEGCYA
jgi:ribosomal protein L37AE/L43A